MRHRPPAATTPRGHHQVPSHPPCWCSIWLSRGPIGGLRSIAGHESQPDAKAEGAKTATEGTDIKTGLRQPIVGPRSRHNSGARSASARSAAPLDPDQQGRARQRPSPQRPSPPRPRRGPRSQFMLSVLPSSARVRRTNRDLDSWLLPLRRRPSATADEPAAARQWSHANGWPMAGPCGLFSSPVGGQAIEGLASTTDTRGKETCRAHQPPLAG